MSAENISYELKRFAGIKRDYTPDEVERLRGSIKIEYSLCKQQSVKLWKLLNTENYISTLGSLVDFPLYKNKIYLEGSIYQYLTFTITAVISIISAKFFYKKIDL